MKTSTKATLATIGAAVVITGGLIWNKLDSWYNPKPDGPGSGDELPWPEPDGPGSGDELPRVEPDGPGSGDELPADWKDNPGSDDFITFADTAKGSCNLIDQASTCVEYQGSYWNSNTSQLACAGGVYSSQACPRPAVGGCRMNPESTYEMITWHYNYGGDPFDGEVVGYAASACNANPAGIWIVIN